MKQKTFKQKCNERIITIMEIFSLIIILIGIFIFLKELIINGIILGEPLSNNLLIIAAFFFSGLCICSSIIIQEQQEEISKILKKQIKENEKT